VSKLIAFSIIHVAPPAFKTPYGVGIAQNNAGKKLLVKIKNEYLNALKSGLEGEIQNEKTETGEFNFFVPK
jgi:uncharacterized OB-fold protein